MGLTWVTEQAWGEMRPEQRQLSPLCVWLFTAGCSLNSRRLLRQDIILAPVGFQTALISVQHGVSRFKFLEQHVSVYSMCMYPNLWVEGTDLVLNLWCSGHGSLQKVRLQEVLLGMLSLPFLCPSH